MRAELDGDERATLLEMAKDWRFLASTLDMVEMVMAKSSPDVAARYDAALAPPALLRFGAGLRAKHSETVAALVETRGTQTLLANNPVLARSIAVRNPYFDPLNLLQIGLLARYRAGEAGVADALALTIHGIAAGMRNTG